MSAGGEWGTHVSTAAPSFFVGLVIPFIEKLKKFIQKRRELALKTEEERKQIAIQEKKELFEMFMAAIEKRPKESQDTVIPAP